MLRTNQQQCYVEIKTFFLIQSILFLLIGLNYFSITQALNIDIEYINCLQYAYHILRIIALYCSSIMSYCTYMSILGFIPALIILIIATFYPQKLFIRALCVLISSLSIAMLIADIMAFKLYKFHIDIQLLSVYFNSVVLSTLEQKILIISFITIISTESILLYLVTKKTIYCNIHQGTLICSWILGLNVIYASLLVSITQNMHIFSQQIQQLPLISHMNTTLLALSKNTMLYMIYQIHFFNNPNDTNITLKYPMKPLHYKKKPIKPYYNIIFITADALRYDAVSAKIMPYLFSLKTDAWYFEHHTSGGNSTQSGIFALFFSLPSSYWQATINQHIQPIFLHLLQTLHYKQFATWSSTMQQPAFTKNVFLKFKPTEIYEAILHNKSCTAATCDHKTTIHAIRFLNQQKDRPFFMHVFYYSTHEYCDDGKYGHVFQPTAICNRLSLFRQKLSKQARREYFNRYLNTAHYIDQQINTLVSTIKKLGYWDNSIVIITSDHGEEFNDNKQGIWGHASNYTDAQVHIPLLIHWPKQAPKIIKYKTTSYDIIPTLMTRLFKCKNAISDYSYGHDLLNKAHRPNFIIASSYNDTGIIEPTKLTTLTSYGTITCTDKHEHPLQINNINISTLQKSLTIMQRYYTNK